MIPELDENGNLPPGEHPASIEEVIERFGGKRYLSRRLRTDSLLEFYDFVRDFALALYIDGSYVTEKLAPSDVDVMVILPEDFNFESFEARELIRLRKAKKSNFLDIFPRAKGRHDLEIANMLNGWTTDIYNDNVEKGIILVEIPK